MKLTHKHTLAASYLGYITQAVVNNLTPLLFVVFETSLGISIGRISLLITVNFGVQMLVDLLSAKWIDIQATENCKIYYVLNSYKNKCLLSDMVIISSEQMFVKNFFEQIFEKFIALFLLIW